MHIFFEVAYWEAKLSSQNKLPTSENVNKIKYPVCLLGGSIILTKRMVSLPDYTFLSSFCILGGEAKLPPSQNVNNIMVSLLQCMFFIIN